ncbi:DUF5131 family protein [Hwanghaeella sp.]|uniref:DUF5131 family protein n=1 Tax=Hwanghaeella sp. TaxID=2605943 RepID=UPI003CCB73CE
MAENTAISWTDHTFNPWIGCTKVSPACDHCYAEAWDKRFGGERWAPGATRTRTSADNWKQPRKWNAAAERAGVRKKVFCASLADVFDNKVPSEWRANLWELIRKTPSLDWLLLTKRPQNIEKMLPENWGIGWPNVWLGTTVENQEEAERRIPSLLSIPARVRFLSCEPLLGPVDLTKVQFGQCLRNCLTGSVLDELGQRKVMAGGPRIHWVIAGGESGPGARPSHPYWFRQLRDQCAEAGTAFHFKQQGDWRPVSPYDCAEGETVWSDHTRQLKSGDIWTDNRKCRVLDHGGGCWENEQAQPPSHAWVMERVGKAKAGRMLDGVTHDGYPGGARDA